jgi:hypothetical protein
VRVLHHGCEMTAQTVTKPRDGRVVGPYENVKLIPKWSGFVTFQHCGEVHGTLAPWSLVASGAVPTRSNVMCVLRSANRDPPGTVVDKEGDLYKQTRRGDPIIRWPLCPAWRLL